MAQSEQLSRAEQVAALWPYDGPHDEDAVYEALDAAANLLRYCANATQPRTATETLTGAPQINRVGNRLGDIVMGLDQVIDQVGKSLAQHASDPTLYDDRRRSVADGHERAEQTAAEAVAGLQEARQHTGKVLRLLTDVQFRTVHLGHDES